MQNKNRFWVPLSGTVLFVVLVADQVKNTNAQEPKKQRAQADSTYVHNMRKPWTPARVYESEKYPVINKPKNPPVYKEKKSDWIEFPADSVRMIPQPVVNKSRGIER